MQLHFPREIIILIKKAGMLQGQEGKRMARNKTAQGGISLRRKVTAWLAAILLVTMLSTGIATMQVSGRYAPLICCWPTTPSATRCKTPSRTKHRPLHAMCASLLLKPNRPIPPPAPLPSRALRPCPSIMPHRRGALCPHMEPFARVCGLSAGAGCLFAAFPLGRYLY